MPERRWRLKNNWSNILPKDTLGIAHHWLILHGRYICLARSPKCEICPISWFCKYYERNHTETALLKAEALKAKKAKDQKKKKQSKYHQQGTEKAKCG